MRELTVLSACAALTACSMTSSNTNAGAHKGPAAVTMQRLLNANSEPGQWMSTGRTYDEQHFSPLSQINTSCKETLKVEDVQAVRAYLISRAHAAKSAQR